MLVEGVLNPINCSPSEARLSGVAPVAFATGGGAEPHYTSEARLSGVAPVAFATGGGAEPH
jgi:hypothetical protein